MDYCANQKEESKKPEKGTQKPVSTNNNSTKSEGIIKTY